MIATDDCSIHVVMGVMKRITHAKYSLNHTSRQVHSSGLNLTVVQAPILSLDKVADSYHIEPCVFKDNYCHY